MPYYAADALPSEVFCGVCRRTQPIDKHRRRRERSQLGQEPGWYLDDICQLCCRRHRAGSLSSIHNYRFLEIRHRTRAAGLVQTRKNQGRLAKRGDPIPKGVPAFDRAMAELEVEWGKPASEWTLKDDYQCTVRIYEILGWPVSELSRTSATAHDTRENRMRGSKYA